MTLEAIEATDESVDVKQDGKFVVTVTEDGDDVEILLFTKDRQEDAYERIVFTP